MRKSDRIQDSVQIKDLVDRILKAYQLDEKMDEMAVLDKWEEMMGKAVALRTRKLYIKNQTLFLEIDSSVMREELSYGKNIIIQRVNQVAGKELVTDVFFK